jgi:hypothetical protein
MPRPGFRLSARAARAGSVFPRPRTAGPRVSAAADRLRRPGAGGGSPAQILLDLQGSAGNASVANILSGGSGSGGPRPASAAAMGAAAREGASRGLLLALAGGKQPEPKPEAPPEGLAAISKRRLEAGHIGFTGGLTQIKSSAAFKAPVWTVQTETRTAGKGEGEKTSWFARVGKTTTESPEHDSWYAEKGLHERPGMATEKDGRSCPRYWEVSGPISRDLRKGEKEHLDDAALAFELTYERITAVINELSKAPIGPAESSDEAKALANRTLEQRLPPELGADPQQWPPKLDILVTATVARDQKGWHYLYNGPPYEKDCSTIDPVEAGADFSVDKHKSKEIVNYKVLAP